MKFDLKTALANVAPTLATMLGGPLAGTAVTALCSALGLAPSATVDDVTKVVQTGMTPENIAAIRATDQKHQEILAQQNIDLQKLNADHAQALATIDAGDRDSARKREVDAKDSITPRLLALLVTVGFFGVCFYLLLIGKPSQGGDALLVMLGSLGTAWTAIVSYYFGSSAGSQRKDELLANSVPVSKAPG